MRILLWLLTLFASAIGLAVLARFNPGNVVLFYPPYRVDLSLNFFLAAVVLYFLASSGVRGFAFTLGLTTLLDILVVFLFTHPVVGILAETKFFGGGHKWSGFDPDRLGASGVTYAGRGRVTIADRRAAAATEGSHV